MSSRTEHVYCVHEKSSMPMQNRLTCNWLLFGVAWRPYFAMYVIKSVLSASSRPWCTRRVFFSQIFCTIFLSNLLLFNASSHTSNVKSLRTEVDFPKFRLWQYTSDQSKRSRLRCHITKHSTWWICLIVFVSQHPVLFDKWHNNYKDNKFRDNLLEENSCEDCDDSVCVCV